MSLLNLLFPHRCLGCREILLDGAFFCGICADTLVRMEQPYCPVCGEPGAFGVCFLCQKTPPLFEKVHASYLYGGAIVEALHRFKYGDSPHLSKPLARLTSLHIPAALDWCSVIVPIPLHPRRLRERGYDQASLLAKELAGQANRLLRLRGLSRVLDTPPQVGKDRQQRATNVHGSFVAVSNGVKGQKVLLVDDVLTTGATANEAARALCQAGAQSVQVLVVARAI